MGNVVLPLCSGRTWEEVERAQEKEKASKRERERERERKAKRRRKKGPRVSSLHYRLADVLITTEIGHKIHSEFPLQITHLVFSRKQWFNRPAEPTSKIHLTLNNPCI